MIPWRYKVTWEDGRTEEVTIQFGDQARFEAKVGRALWMILEGKMWTTYMDLQIVHLALTRMRVEPVQTIDEFVDTIVELEQLQFGDPAGKAPGRAPSSGRSQRSRPSGATTP